MALLRRRLAQRPAESPSEEPSTAAAPRRVTNEPKEEITVSTGSTLLDLAIFGGRKRGGGIPGGLIIEVFGDSGLGKTAILAEICGSSQAMGGDVRFADPEGRLDRSYAETYGVHLPADKYFRPDYVEEVFNDIKDWHPRRQDVINIYGCDSLAALTTKIEMDNPEGDKMGMKRAKDMSAGLRKTGRILAERGDKLLVCTNQIRTGDKGTFTPGGKGIPFWSTVRMQVLKEYRKGKKSKITKEVKVGDKNKIVQKIIGINSIVKVVKNTRDDPYREAPISIIFGYGIDDIRGNLQWYKDMTGDTTYNAVTNTYQQIDAAIKYVEDNNHEQELRDMVIDLWEEIEGRFNKSKVRKKKIR